MKDIFYFGEKHKEFKVRVLNEREVRAAAGILFVFAMFAFLFAALKLNFYPLKIFILVFFIDFVIRVFINPKYSPTLILGRIFVKNQIPEYVGAPQKRFAWSIGLFLSILMVYLIIIQNYIGLINAIICLICLIFLFAESALGICMGCRIYNLSHKNKAKMCPGGVCEFNPKQEIQKISIIQIIILVLFIALVFFGTTFFFSQGFSVTNQYSQQNLNINNQNLGENTDCIVPNWAIAIGHEELYKEHHGCLGK